MFIYFLFLVEKEICIAFLCTFYFYFCRDAEILIDRGEVNLTYRFRPMTLSNNLECFQVFWAVISTSLFPLHWRYTYAFRTTWLTYQICKKILRIFCTMINISISVSVSWLSMTHFRLYKWTRDESNKKNRINSWVFTCKKRLSVPQKLNNPMGVKAYKKVCVNFDNLR